MATNDVSVTIEGPLPIKPIGVEMTFGVNAIHVCIIEMDATNSAILQEPDSYKRKGLITVTLTVKTNTVQFVGYFDGLSVSQSVGGISYFAVLKGQAQLLLETDTTIPGLSPYGMNPFAIAQPQTITTANDITEQIVSMQIGLANIQFSNASVAEAYKQLALACLSYQSDGGFAALVASQQKSGLDVT